MSRYVVEVKDPKGKVGYLCLGRVVRYENAQRYPHPSNARQALKSYRAKLRKQYTDTLMTIQDRRG